MYSKIDERLLSKIKSQKLGDSVDIIVFAEDYLKAKDYLKDKFNKIIELPIIESVALSCSYGDLCSLAQYNFVKYISSNAKVNSLVFNARNFTNAKQMNNLTVSSERHSVVVVDTGVYPHIDFCLGKNRIIHFVDLIDNKLEMYDDNGHGTFVTGVIGARSIVSNESGFDNNANIIVIKALDKDGETTTIKILQAMQWIQDNRQRFNIKVVCMSFGSIMLDHNDPLMHGAEILWNNGISVICAAGNSGPASNTIMSPGSSKKVITVGSLDNISTSPTVAEFSSKGPVFNYYKPDMLLPGVDIVSTNIFSKDKKFYTTMSGTSVSTPMVAGIASLLYNHNPNYSPDQIKYMLINSCVRITGDRNSEGFGYLDLNKLILL